MRLILPRLERAETATFWQALPARTVPQTHRYQAGQSRMGEVRQVGANRLTHPIALPETAHRGSSTSGRVTTKMLDGGAPSQVTAQASFSRYLPLSAPPDFPTRVTSTFPVLEPAPHPAEVDGARGHRLRAPFLTLPRLWGRPAALLVLAVIDRPVPLGARSETSRAPASPHRIQRLFRLTDCRGPPAADHQQDVADWCDGLQERPAWWLWEDVCLPNLPSLG